eukprot:COSAG01_NODE_1_length_100484_cov_170.446142_41_plen_168_part_00
MTTITKDSVVDIHYTLTNDTGKVLDSSKGQDPLQFIFGSGMIIKGLERELEGKKKGDKFVAIIAPEDAYGLRSDKHVSKVPINQFETPENVKVGARFQVGGQGGTIAEVIAVDTESVTVDTNHPLADQTLHFDVEVLALRQATAEELNPQPNTGAESDCCSQGTCSE